MTTAATTTTTSRERLAASLNHIEPDKIPIDFGSTAVTGIHVSCVAALRDYFGLEKWPVMVHEPFQMLGLVENDLRAAMRIDVAGVFGRNTMFGFPADDWKNWNLNGLDVLVPGKFNVTVNEKRRHADLSRGRYDGSSQRKDAAGWLFLRQHHPAGANRRR